VVVVVGMHQPLVEEASAPEIYVEDIDRWGVWLGHRLCLFASALTSPLSSS
jgi:hypothetical protein